MGLLGKLFKSTSEKDSHKKLSDAYEKERQRWIKNGFNGGTGAKTAKMKRLDKKLSKHAAKEWKTNPKRNRNPNYRWTDANRWDKE